MTKYKNCNNIVNINSIQKGENEMNLKKQKRDSVLVTITIPSLFLANTKESAKKRGMSLSGYIRFAISELQKGE